MYSSGSFLFKTTPFEAPPEPLFDKYGPLSPEEQLKVPGSDGAQYKVMRRKNYYQCTCPAFVFQYDTLWEHRTCKHLIRLRGKMAEDERINESKIFIYGSLGKKLIKDKPPLTKEEENFYGPMFEGEQRVVKGTAGAEWVVERKRDYYQCTCPAFRFQKNIHWEARTCKHIISIRGEKKEKQRLMEGQVRKMIEKEQKASAKRKTMASAATPKSKAGSRTPKTVKKSPASSPRTPRTPMKRRPSTPTASRLDSPPRNALKTPIKTSRADKSLSFFMMPTLKSPRSSSAMKSPSPSRRSIKSGGTPSTKASSRTTRSVKSTRRTSMKKSMKSTTTKRVNASSSRAKKSRSMKASARAMKKTRKK